MSQKRRTRVGTFDQWDPMKPGTKYNPIVLARKRQGEGADKGAKRWRVDK